MIKKYLALALALLTPLQVQARNTPTDTVQYSTQGSAPSSPVAGTVMSYHLSSDGAPYFKNSSGSAFGLAYSSAVFANHGVIVGTGSNRSLGYVAPCNSLEALFGVTGADPACRVIALTDFPSQAAATFLGRASGAGSGTPTALSASQASTIIAAENLSLTKHLSIAQTTDSSTGNIDSLTTTNISSIRLTGAAPVLRGIANGSDGKILLLTNAAGISVSVKNQDSNPTAANKIITGTAADIALADNASLLLQYDATTSRWRVIGGSGSGGGGSSGTGLLYSSSTAGSATFTVPAETYAIWVRASGGGGAGGSSWTSPIGSGGGGGSYDERLLRVTPGEDITVVVGAKGVGPALNSGSGGNGGDTKLTYNGIDIYVVPGGLGGLMGISGGNGGAGKGYGVSGGNGCNNCTGAATGLMAFLSNNGVVQTLLSIYSTSGVALTGSAGGSAGGSGTGGGGAGGMSGFGKGGVGGGGNGFGGGCTTGGPGAGGGGPGAGGYAGCDGGDGKIEIYAMPGL